MWKWGFEIAAAAAMTLALGCTSALSQEGEASFSYQTDTGICKGIEYGDRIRISVNSEYAQEISDYLGDGGTITGNLVSCDDGVVLLEINNRGSNADPLRIPADKVDWLEVSQGRSSHSSTGAAIGLATGFVVGLSLQREETPSAWLEVIPKDQYQNAARFAGAMVGGVIVGAIIGSFIGSEKWEKVYEDYSINLQGNNAKGEYQLTVAFSF